jgi:hypothetical protein
MRAARAFLALEGPREFQGWFSERVEAALVSRFRSSPDFAARSGANFGIEGHQQIYDSSAALNPKFATGLAAACLTCASKAGKWLRGFLP